MNRVKTLIICLILCLILLAPEIASAQQVYPAAGSLTDSEGGLWNYYRGKTRSTVKRNAPMFERLPNSTSYLLDYQEIKGIELYLTCEFKNNKLSSLQLTMPFPEYDKCSKDTKDMSREFAKVGYAMMGVEFNSKNQCTQTKDASAQVVCAADDYACVYKLCPGASWTMICTELTK